MMKKIYTLLSFIVLLGLNNLKAQELYLSTAQTGYRYNPGSGSSNTPIIVFDDVNILSSDIADADSIGFTKIKVGIRQIANAPAVTVKVYITGQDPNSASFTGIDSFPAVPPTLIGTFNLPANTGAGFLNIISIGDSVNVFKALARDTGNLFTGFQTVYLGVSFSNSLPSTTNPASGPANGWRFTTDGNNADIGWQYDVDSLAAPRFAIAGFQDGSTIPATPIQTTFYAEVYGRKKYLTTAIDASVSDITVPAKTTCYNGNQTVNVKIENLGTTAIAAGAASVNVSITGPNAASLTLTNPVAIPSNTIGTVTFNNVVITTPGTNIYIASVTLPGDARQTNDTLATANFTGSTISAFPATDDAETFLDPIITDVEVISLDQGWNYFNDFAGLPLPNRSFVDTLFGHSGSGFYFFDGFNQPAGVESRLYTNCIKLGATASGGGACGSSVSFWTSADSSWADFGDDSLFLSVSTDKGVSYTRLVGFSTLDLFAGTVNWVQNIVDLSAYNGQTIQLGFEGVSGFRQAFGLDDIEIVSNCVVPVTLTNFSVQKQSKANRLNWTTSQELNSLKYVVEQSKNGREFVSLGEVAAAGNSSTERTYSFTHNLPTKGYNYYRLKIVDRDNKVKFSPTRSVQNLGTNEISTYPNPVSGTMQVTVNSERADMANVVISDVSGKVVYSNKFTVSEGDNNFTINTSSLTAGNYVIKIQLNGDMSVKKFTKL